MRYLTVILLFLLLNITPVQNIFSQDISDFSHALRLYESNNFSVAADEFSKINTPIARLYLAKSYYALNDFQRAIEIASPLSTQPPVQIVQEAQFLRALSHFQLKEFHRSLELLMHLKTNAGNADLKLFSENLYNDIVDYLSFNQRVHVVRSTRNADIREDVVTNHLMKYPAVQAWELVQQLMQQNPNNDYAHLLDIVDTIPLFYEPSQAPGDAPTGTLYRIGVLLPSFEDDPDEKEVSKGLYNGILLAADEFNRRNTSQKVAIYFSDSSDKNRSLSRQTAQLIEQHKIDAIIGPLFSDEVSEVASVVERYSIPLFAPLANTISFDSKSNFVYQVNPSFNSRGRKTARLLREDMNRVRFGVIAERGTLGEQDAIAFKNEAEKLGAEVPFLFVENFANRGYYLGDLLPWFANNEELIDTTRYVADSLDAVYLPFTGQAAPVLLELALTGLQAFQADYVIISNEEMLYLNHSRERIRRLNMIYSDTFFLSEGEESAINFKYDYRNRTGTDPNTFSYIGYDIASFYLNLLEKYQNPDNIRDFMEFNAQFDGIATSILFGNTNINQALQFFRITGSRPENVNPVDYWVPDRVYPEYSDQNGELLELDDDDGEDNGRN